MSIPQAIEGAKAELGKVQGFQRVQRLAVYARIFAAEILGTVAAAPFGLRAFSLHRSLPDARRQRPSGTVSTLRDVSYGSRARNVMDVYLPPQVKLSALEQPPVRQQPSDGLGGSTTSAVSDALPAANTGAWGAQAGAAAGAGDSKAGGGEEPRSQQGAPVVLFCHGGVWAAGSKWHYAPLATRLAQAGVITAVMQYTLYPDALIPQMAAEVSGALSWTMDNAGRLGGSPRHVSLVGHSAGAHLCTMALLHRALAASKVAEAQAQGSRPPAGRSEQRLEDLSPAAAAAAAPAWREPPAATAAAASTVAAPAAAASAAGCEAHGDHRMPLQLVAMSGVYDISKHYQYEEGRQVHKLSTMERACGGSHRFPHNSPAVILASALRQQPQLRRQHSSWSALQANSDRASEEGQVPARADNSWSAVSGGPGSAGLPSTAAASVGQPGVQQSVQEREPGQERLETSTAAAGSKGRQGSGAASPRFYQSFELAGEAIAQRIGFNRAPRAGTAAATGDGAVGGVGTVHSATAGPLQGLRPAAADAGCSGAADAGDGIMGFTVQAARLLPPTVLTSSTSDVTVPWYQSAEQYWMLHDCGVPVRHLVYDKVSHGDFVTGWKALPRVAAEPATDASDLPPHAADLLCLLAPSARRGGKDQAV